MRYSNNMKKTKDTQQARPQSRDTMFAACFKNAENFLYVLKRCRGSDIILTEHDLEPLDFEDMSAEDIDSFDLNSLTIRRKRRNDVSFMTKDGKLIILVEHSTTLPPNLALKIFLYYIELIHLYSHRDEKN